MTIVQKRIEWGECCSPGIPRNPKKRWQRQADTSIEAYQAIKAKMPERCVRILNWLRSRGELGATNDEIAQALKLPIQSIPNLNIKLRRQGLIKASHDRRPTRFGAAATVWLAVSDISGAGR